MKSSENRQPIEELVALYKGCSDVKKKRLFHLRIVERTLGLVKRIATPIAVQASLPAEDLIQVGALGLIKAIDFYEPDKNAKFETYANYFIKGEIRHFVRDKAGLIKMPRKIQELLGKINNAKKALAEDGINEPSAEELADYLGLPVLQINEILKIEQYKSLISLDQAVSAGEDETSLLDKIPAANSQSFWESYEDRIMLSDAVNRLPQELRQIIELSFYKDFSQREISEMLGMSPMQVSRRLKKALSCLYEIIKRN